MQPLQPDQASFLLTVLTGQIQHEHKTTLKVIEAIPLDQGGYQPDPRSMTALDLAWHIVSAEIFFMDGVLSGAFKAGDGKRPGGLFDSAAVAAWSRANFPGYLDRLKEVPAEQLLKHIVFHGYDVPAIAYVQTLLTHTIHHRGQLSAYLRPMGAKVPAIHGGSADEPTPGA